MSQLHATNEMIRSPQADVSVVHRHRVANRFRRNVLSNVGGNALYMALQLVLMVLLYDLLEAKAYADWLTVAAIVGVCEMTSDFGARLWATREFSVSQTPREILIRSIWCKVFYTLASIAVLLALPATSLSTGLLVLSIAVAGTQPGTDPFLWYLRGCERFDIEAAVVLFFRVAAVLLMLAAACLGGATTSLMMIWLVSNLARFVFEMQLPNMRPLFTGISLNQFRLRRHMLQTLVIVFPVGATLCLTSLFQRIGILLVDMYSTTEDVKIFGTAFRLVTTGGFMATGMFVSSFSPLVRAIQSQDHVAASNLIRRELMLVTAVYFPICLAGVFLSVPIAQRLFSQHGSSIGYVMALLMPGLYLSCVNMGLKYTMNAFALNWFDVSAVVLGIAVICGITLFRGNLTWVTVSSIAWGLAETSVLTTRILVLRKLGRHTGVPLGVISLCSIVLILPLAFMFEF